MRPTQRGKTTPASTPGSYSPHTGRASRVEPDNPGQVPDVGAEPAWCLYQDTNGQPVVVCVQDFDMPDYEPTRWLSNVTYTNPAAADEALTATFPPETPDLAESWEAFHDKHGQFGQPIMWASLGRDGDGDGDQIADGPGGQWAEIGKEHPNGWSWSIMMNDPYTVDVNSGRADTEAEAKAAATTELLAGATPYNDNRAALAELRRRGISGWAASLAAANIQPTQMVELADAGVPLGGHGPALSKKIPVTEIADAQTHGIDLYEYDRARSRGRLDRHQLNTPPDHADVINAYKAGANLAAFGLIAGQHRIEPVEAAEAAASRHLPPLGYLALRETSGCSHSEAMEVANAVTRDGYRFEAQSTYDGLRAAGCSHAQIVQALTLTPAHDRTGLTTLFDYRNLLWEHSHDAAITRLTDAR